MLPILGIASLVGTIFNAATGAVELAEKTFPSSNGEKRGEEKKGFVMSLLNIAVDALDDAGKLPPIVKSNREVLIRALDKLIELAVQVVKKKTATVS